MKKIKGKTVFKQKEKQEKGITLIALVITIIVLLILAGVAISTLTGENGILTKATMAKQQSEIASAKEQAQMDISVWITDKLKKGEDASLSNSIIKGILEGKDYVKKANNSSFISKEGEHEIKYSELNIGNIENDITDETGENEIKVIDLVLGKAENDYTSQIEDLGIPLITKYPDTTEAHVLSRKVWDMQLFNNRIYIGSGDYNLNTGPVDVYYYDITNEKFVKEATLPDEQINRFVVIDNKLMITGTDPQEGWEMGNFFIWENNNWIKKRNLLGGVHNFDLIEYKGNLFAGLGTVSNSSIVMSEDNGETFSYVYLYNDLGEKIDINENSSAAYRVYDLFEFKNSLYAFCNRSLYKYNEEGNRFEKVPSNRIDYGTMNVTSHVPLKTKTVFDDKLVLINGSIKYTEDLLEYKTVAFDQTTYVYDVLERNGQLYMLCNTPVSNGFITSVFKTEDCVNYELELYFNYTDYSFSFEYADGAYYFGIGTTANSGEKGANSGRILRIEL